MIMSMYTGLTRNQHGLSLAPRLPPAGPANLGTGNVTPKGAVRTIIVGAIVATGAFGPNGKASFVGFAGSASSAQTCPGLVRV